MPVILIQPHYISYPGVAARIGAGRPYGRNKYPQTTPVSRRENFFFTFFQKRLGKVLEYFFRKRHIYSIIAQTLNKFADGK